MKPILVKLYLFFLSTILCGGYSVYGQEIGEQSTNKTITLKQAIEVALKKNHSLQRSRLNIASSSLTVKNQEDEFDIKVRPSTTAGIYSSDNKYLIGELEFSKKTQFGITASIAPQIERNDDTYRSSINVSLNVPLFGGFGTDSNLDGYHSSLFELENAQRSFYQQQVNIVLNTVTTIYEIIKNQQQMQLLTTQLRLLDRHLSLTTIKEKSGLSSAMDLYRAEIRGKEIQNELTTVQEQFDTNVDQLKDLLAIPIQGDMIVNAPVHYRPIVTNPQHAITIALENRIELEQSQRRNEELKRKLILAKKNILPKINMKMDYEKYGENSSFDLTEENWSISLDGSSDLFRATERTAFQQAKIRLQQSKIDLESEKQRIVKEVRAQINQMNKKHKLIADQREQARQAEGRLELSLSKFNHGLADNFDLLESQSQTQQVKSDLLFDTISYIVDTYRLRKVLGTLIVR